MVFAMTGIVRGDCSCFAAGSQILAGIEAECRGSAHRSGLHPAVVLSREILGAVGLAGIFDHDQTVALGQFQNRHPCRPSVRTDGLERRR